MTEMMAARLIKPGEPLRIENVSVPKPAADEVLVKVAACGLCGTDIHLAIDGDIPVAHTPITLGHEAAGTVTATGSDVTEFNEGDRVALFPAASCGACRFCEVGRESLCENSKVYGMARDGGLANYVTAPARSVVRVPDNVPFDIAAIITDGVSTPFHALRSRGQLIEGEAVAVVGCGGLGTHGIILARMMGAGQIIAFDTQLEARERALEVGADLALDPMEPDAVKAMRSHLNRAGVDLSLEFVGRAVTAELAIKLLDKTGRAVLVGVGMERPKLPPMVAFAGREQSVIGSFGMDRSDIEDLLEAVSSGALDLSKSVSARYSLADADAALQHLARKDTGTVRVVVVPEE